MSRIINVGKRLENEEALKRSSKRTNIEDFGNIPETYFMSKKTLEEVIKERNSLIEQYKQNGFNSYTAIFKSLKLAGKSNP